MNIAAHRDGDLAFHDPESIAIRQNELFLRHIRYLSRNSSFYRRQFCDAGIDPRDIRSIRDLSALPMTGKADLAGAPDDFLCVAPDKIVDFCLTSGTTGTPVPMQQTADDLERLAFNEELAFRAADITADDRVLIAVALDRCFMAGLAYFLGLVRIGAVAIRGGSGSVPVLNELVCRYRPTVIIGVPTLLLKLAERLQAQGFDPCAMGVKRLVCIGEPIRNSDLSLSVLGRRLQDLWGSQPFGTYASTEMATSFCDCSAGWGGHIPPELVLVEIVDEQGRLLPPGSPGEVVATPLQVTGMPLLRFRTGDIAAFHEQPCPCRRKTPRLGPLLGRLAQMLKVRGTTLFPQSIFSVLEEIKGVRGYYLEVFDEFDLSDKVRVVVAGDSGLDPENIGDCLAARLRVRLDVSIRPAEEVHHKAHPGDKRKPVLFFDYRRNSSQGKNP